MINLTCQCGSHDFTQRKGNYIIFGTVRVYRSKVFSITDKANVNITKFSRHNVEAKLRKTIGLGGCVSLFLTTNLDFCVYKEHNVLSNLLNVFYRGFFFYVCSSYISILIRVYHFLLFEFVIHV